jgi:hypothetical protein
MQKGADPGNFHFWMSFDQRIDDLTVNLQDEWKLERVKIHDLD